MHLSGKKHMERRQENNKYQVNFVNFKPPFSFSCSQFDDSVKCSLLKLFSVPPELFLRIHMFLSISGKNELDTTMPVARGVWRPKKRQNEMCNCLDLTLFYVVVCVFFELESFHCFYYLIARQRLQITTARAFFFEQVIWRNFCEPRFRHSVNHFTWSAEKRFRSLVG